MTIRAVIVDDEAPARDKLRRYLAAETDVELLGEAADGASAADAIRRLAPDLVFLDVVMPGMDGFELLRQLEDDELPEVVFVTAHDEHAVRAFDVNAVDYLLKPVDPDRFARTLARIRGRRAHGDRSAPDRTRQAISAVAPAPPPIEALLVPFGNQTRLLSILRIDWGETAGNYTAIHADQQTYVLRQPMSRLLDRLDASQFARIHRMRFVNLDRVREWQSAAHGDMRLHLVTGRELLLSRRHRREFLSRWSAARSRSSRSTP